MPNETSGKVQAKAIDEAIETARKIGWVDIPSKEAKRRKELEAYKRVAGNHKGRLAIRAFKDDKIIREIMIFPEKDKIIVEEHELVEDKISGKEHLQIIYCNVHDKHMYARADFMGRVAALAYEHANNEVNSEFGNMFVRNSLNR